MNYDECSGQHVVCDMWGIKSELLDDIDNLIKIGTVAIKHSNATYVDKLQKHFIPNGVTLLFLLEESHLSFHTYPSKNFIAVDCFTCGSQTNPNIAVDYIIEKLQPDPNRIYRQTIIRGVE